MLEMNGVDYAYPGGIPALSAVDMAIKPGEKVAIVGANGAGKTTLLSILNGTIRPDHGAVRLDGAAIRYDRAGLRGLRQAVGLVLQDPDDQLFAASVFEDVSFGPVNLGLAQPEIRARVEASLLAMGIGDLGDRPTHMLSFGQKKRVAIAGIIAMRPRYLLLDEPSAGLDPMGVSQLMASLQRISADGTAIVLATHDMYTAYAWADRILIFGDGRIACAGDPELVFSDRALLARLQLEPPLIGEAARALRQAGLVNGALKMPRDREGLLAEIKLAADMAAALAG